jgi:hypothetical protein
VLFHLNRAKVITQVVDDDVIMLIYPGAAKFHGICLEKRLLSIDENSTLNVGISALNGKILHRNIVHSGFLYMDFPFNQSHFVCPYGHTWHTFKIRKVFGGHAFDQDIIRCINDVFSIRSGCVCVLTQIVCEMEACARECV